ncbi:hypothetical protein OIU78_001730 [Salix suchowensis]|nr:hypothetical protein OIU78_001730 [Salix suchowensis]
MENVKPDGGSGGQVLDLQTTIKGGILGGVGGGLVCSGVKEKLDLRKMVEELESIHVPSVFICPISLDPMQEPVTLCTGQTYERSNILKWFSLGHCTCPTTMQELWDDTVTPNRTLQQLIHSWFSSKYLAMKKRSEDVLGRAIELLDSLKKVKGQARVQTLKQLRHVVVAHSTAKKTVMDKGGAAVVSSLLGPFTTHAVGSEAIGILVNLELDLPSKAKFEAAGKESAQTNPLRSSVVSIGAVPPLVELLPSLNNECLELALYILEVLSTVPEGRLALKDCASTIPNAVRLLMSRSESCTQLALSILWAVCKLALEECAALAVEAGLAAKLLLVIQSGCNPVLKQRSVELLKLCSLNYTAAIFISKCKLTRTIQ